MGFNTLKQSVETVEGVAGGTQFPHCSEAWDAISRYIYIGLQGGSIMRGWMNDERVMIACCSDGIRPVIFKIERMDYKVVYIEGISCDKCRTKIKEALEQQKEITNVVFKKDIVEKEYMELFLDQDISDDIIVDMIENLGSYQVAKID